MPVQPLRSLSRPLRTPLKAVAGTAITPVADDPASRELLISILSAVTTAGMNARVSRLGTSRAHDVTRGLEAGYVVGNDEAGAHYPVLPEGMTLQTVRGRRGLWQGLQPRLDLVIIGIEAASDRSLAKAMIDARALSQRLERATPIVATSHDFETPSSAEGDLVYQSVAKTAADIVARPQVLDVIVTSLEHAEVLAAAALAASGAQTGLPRARRVGQDVVFDNTAPNAGGTADCGALIDTALLMMRLMGAMRAAGRLEDALVATLEMGLHPPAQRLVLPYSRQLDDGAFLLEIRGQLGERPRETDSRTHLRSVGS